MKRYEMTEHRSMGDVWDSMDENASGDWVKFEDAQARIDALEKALREIRTYLAEKLEVCDSPGSRQTLQIHAAIVDTALEGKR